MGDCCDASDCTSCQDCTDHNCVKKSGEECSEDSDCSSCQECDENCDCDCVTITSLTADVEAACVGSNVTFTVVTDPANRCECVTWSGSPSGGEGCQRTYSWGSSGLQTVTAWSSCNSGSSKSKEVTIVKIENVEFSPEELYADGVSTSTASADITPGSRTITWSIQGNALGCSINASTGVITAGTTEGTITVRAADSEVSDCYAEGNIEVKPDPCLDTSLGSWYNMPVDSINDDCGNNLTLTFDSNVYCYYYNGRKVGNCPYFGGDNGIVYWKTGNGKRFSATYHKSEDDKNDSSSGDEGTKGKYDSVIWLHSCISGELEKTGIEHPTTKGGDDGTGSGFEEMACP